MPFAWQASLDSVCHSVWLCLCVWRCVFVCVCVSHAFKCFPKLPFSHLAAWPIPTQLMLLLPPSLSLTLSLSLSLCLLLYPPFPALHLLPHSLALALPHLENRAETTKHPQLVIPVIYSFISCIYSMSPPTYLPPLPCPTLPIPIGTGRCDSFALHAFFFSHFAWIFKQLPANCLGSCRRPPKKYELIPEQRQLRRSLQYPGTHFSTPQSPLQSLPSPPFASPPFGHCIKLCHMAARNCFQSRQVCGLQRRRATGGRG